MCHPADVHKWKPLIIYVVLNSTTTSIRVSKGVYLVPLNAWALLRYFCVRALTRQYLKSPIPKYTAEVSTVPTCSFISQNTRGHIFQDKLDTTRRQNEFQKGGDIIK